MRDSRLLRDTRGAGQAPVVTLLTVIAVFLGVLAFSGVAEGKHAPARRAATHIGQSVDDFVVLKLINTTGNFNQALFAEVDTVNATVGTTEYTVPDGHLLVVTDVEWGAQAAGTPVAMRVQLESKADATKRIAVAVCQGVNGGRNHTTTGFVVSQSVSIRADAPGGSRIDDPTFLTGWGTATNNTLVILRGYLTEAPK